MVFSYAPVNELELGTDWAGWLAGWLAGWVAGWVAGWLAGWSNDYSANPGSILQAETCKILS